MFDAVSAVAVVGVLVAPMIATTSSLMDTTRARATANALATARNALVAYAAAHDGCLPFAADFEGGLPDTDQFGNPSPDTGVGEPSTYSGDLPWSDLGLTSSFLDGDGLRIQYFVATSYTDDTNTSDAGPCAAGSRGGEWDPSLAYDGTGSNQYVYYTPTGSERQLYEIYGILPEGSSPDGPNASDVNNITEYLPAALLAVHRGPDVVGPGGQSDVLSAQNVFVLIAIGKNRNSYIEQPNFRDANHAKDEGGGMWPASSNKMIVDQVMFASTHDADATNDVNDGDDTLLVMSMTKFMVELSKYHITLAPICASSC